VQARKELLSAAIRLRCTCLVGRKRFALEREPLQYGTLLEHGPENWVPVSETAMLKQKRWGG